MVFNTQGECKLFSSLATCRKIKVDTTFNAIIAIISTIYYYRWGLRETMLEGLIKLNNRKIKKKCNYIYRIRREYNRACSKINK